MLVSQKTIKEIVLKHGRQVYNITLREKGVRLKIGDARLKNIQATLQHEN